MHGFMHAKGVRTDTLSFGDTKIIVEYPFPMNNGYGLVIRTGPEEFLAAGVDVRLKFISGNPSKRINIGQVFEGKFAKGKWVSGRMLNGDETRHNERLVMTGRKAEQAVGTTVQPGIGKMEGVYGPGIYKVTTYEMK